MDVKEAIDELKFILEYDKYSSGNITCEALCMAIEALEKQIPQRVMEDEYCPSCDEDIEDCTRYCQNCGQALLWEDE